MPLPRAYVSHVSPAIFSTRRSSQVESTPRVARRAALAVLGGGVREGLHVQFGGRVAVRLAVVRGSVPRSPPPALPPPYSRPGVGKRVYGARGFSSHQSVYYGESSALVVYRRSACIIVNIFKKVHSCRWLTQVSCEFWEYCRVWVDSCRTTLNQGREKRSPTPKRGSASNASRRTKKLTCVCGTPVEDL